MEGNEQLEEMKIRQRRELQIQKQNHMLMRMAGRSRQQLMMKQTTIDTLSNTLHFITPSCHPRSYTPSGPSQISNAITPLITNYCCDI
jgi:hypothetical protein